MTQHFKHIGLFGKHSHPGVSDTLHQLLRFLKARELAVTVETETASAMTRCDAPTCSREHLGSQCDVIIVVGGDGSLLNAARAITHQQIPVLGINRGRLGFLTDIRPNELENKVGEVLDGHYLEEKRFLLDGQVFRDDKLLAEGNALNDIVLYQGDVARMIEFELAINGEFVYSQRSDGLIISTPTGSTAYSLSGGGPILHPELDAVVLVPMFPHTLTSRPIVINGNDKIEIIIAADKETYPRLSFDGQQHVNLAPNDRIVISKFPKQLRLIHPKDYRYYETLRSKLHWGTKLLATHTE